MADVFLSYARSGAEQAKHIAAMLREAGYSVWFDEELPAHRAYADVIATELDAARAVLVLWSEEAAQSQWVRSEANRAREKDSLVQLSLDGARLPMPFDQIQCADLRGWSGEDGASWRSVTGAIASLVRGERDKPSPATAPSQPNSSKDPQANALAAKPSRDSPASPDRRRLLIASGAAAALAAGGFAGWQLLDRDQPSTEATLLLQKGLDALQSNDALETEDPGSTMQAIALLTDATEANPNSSLAWGGLAMAYAVRRKAVPLAERAGLEERSRSAARNSLERDPAEPRALAALLLLQPVYRNWIAAERADRAALRKNPKYPILLFILSDMLGSVGRWKEAAELSARLDRKKFLLPGADRKVIINLWSAGDLQGADQAARLAAERWPQHPQIWRTRIAYLLFSGRASEAVALLDNEAERPPDTPPELVAAFRATGKALTGEGEQAEAVKAALAYLETRPSAALQVAQALAVVGAQDTAFQLLRGYYFGEGAWARLAPAGGDENRLTAPLFQPSMRSLWRRPEFDQLLTRIGLTRYWRESGTLPDYRK